MSPATTKIATCHCPAPEQGRGQIHRIIEIRLDHRTKDYAVTKVHNGTAEWSEWRKTERAALAYAKSLGFTEVVYEAQQ